jgi:hypothetical protein
MLKRMDFANEPLFLCSYWEFKADMTARSADAILQLSILLQFLFPGTDGDAFGLPWFSSVSQ